MNCNETEQHLSAYQDGELTETETAEVKAHLTDCAACRKRLADYEAVFRALGQEKDRDPSPGFTEAVLERATGRSFAILRKPRFWVPAAAVAASLLIAITLLILGAPWTDEAMIEQAPRTEAPADAIAEVEAAVRNDPDLLEILENLDALEDIEVLENLPLLESLEDVEAAPGEDLSEEQLLVGDDVFPVEER